jgi:hypothetical protein
VNAVLRLALIAALLTGIATPASAKRNAARARTPSKADVEAATRLQIFLDRANFSPGKIDGRYNDLTWKALALYRTSRGEQPQTPPAQPHAKHSKAKSNPAPDVNGLDLASVDPVFVPYTVTDADLQSVGPSPKEPPQQAKLKFLPYHDAADALAEKFHSDIHFLEQLNPGKLKAIKVGDQLMVPNVEPFELASVKEIKPGSEVSSQAVNEVEEQSDAQNGNRDENKGATANVTIKIDTKTNTL